MYAQDANMTVVLYDLAFKEAKGSTDSPNPTHVLLLPIETVCEITALQFSNDGRFLFAAVITPSEKKVYLLAWDLTNKTPVFLSSECLPVESVLG